AFRNSLIRDSWGNHRVWSSVLVVTGREAPAEKRGKDVATMLFICREQSVLDEECNIPESIARRGVVVHQIRRHTENNLDPFEGNQFQPFSAIVVVRGNPLAVGLPQLVVAIFLFKTRCGRGYGRDPMRLLVL